MKKGCTHNYISKSLDHSPCITTNHHLTRPWFNIYSTNMVRVEKLEQTVVTRAGVTSSGRPNNPEHVRLPDAQSPPAEQSPERPEAPKVASPPDPA